MTKLYITIAANMTEVRPRVPAPPKKRPRPEPTPLLYKIVSGLPSHAEHIKNMRWFIDEFLTALDNMPPIPPEVFTHVRFAIRKHKGMAS